MQKNSESVSVASVIERHDIKRLLRESFDREEPLVFSPSGVAISFFCLIRELNDNEVLLQNPVKPEWAHEVMASEQFFIFCRAYRIEVLHFSPRGQDLVFQIPEKAYLSQERSKARTYYSEKDRAYVMITHPFDKDTEIRRKLIDSSEGGMSFRASKMTAFIQPGRTLPRLRLFARGQMIGERVGTIIYVTRIVDPEGESYQQVGVQFADLTPTADDFSQT